MNRRSRVKGCFSRGLIRVPLSRDLFPIGSKYVALDRDGGVEPADPEKARGADSRDAGRRLDPLTGSFRRFAVHACEFARSFQISDSGFYLVEEVRFGYGPHGAVHPQILRRGGSRYEGEDAYRHRSREE